MKPLYTALALTALLAAPACDSGSSEEAAAPKSCKGEEKPACSTIADEVSCFGASYCSWGGGSCSGTRSCSDMTAQVPCSTMDGCQWNSTDSACEGIATPCSIVSESMCDVEPGCSWGGEACSGSRLQCDANDTEHLCGTEPDCSWE